MAGDRESLERLARAAVAVLIKWDETSAIYDIECACCPEHAELLAAFEAAGLDYHALIGDSLRERERDESGQ